MFDNIKYDLVELAGNDQITSKLKCILINHTFHLIMAYRTGVVLAKVPLIGKAFRVAIEYFIRVIYASDISLSSQIGPGLRIVHGHDIVIGGSVVIGKRCKILNGVTLGNKDLELPVNQQPNLGDDVTIGSGAKLLGNISVGSGAQIGANSVVIDDVPPNAVVVGVPARIVKEGSIRQC